MQKKKLLASTMLVCLGLFAGCGGEAPSPCEALAEKTKQCFGVGVMPAICDPATAEQLALSDCASLVQYVTTRKSDGSEVEEQIRASIREAIKQSIEAAFEQALAQILSVLGDLDQWRFYLLFKEEATREAAEASAQQFAHVLDGAESMAPFVYEKKDCVGCEARYWVIHGPCPIPLTKIGGVVVDLVLEYPGLLSLMGGTGQTAPVDLADGTYETNINLPLQILPMGLDAPAAFGCSAP